ncbi:MAG TPA: hypothetical protein VEJ63_14715 [Planctomycetota bacterium]|nr:hypothetical protein [Planctomycetota bacterium]
MSQLFPNDPPPNHSMAEGYFERLYHEMLNWCQGRSWLARLPLWIFLCYIAVRLVQDPAYWSVFNFLNLAIHEWGHVLFRPLGMFMMIAGGTILQLLAPAASIFMFLKQRDYFGIAVCFCWLSTNIYGVALYMSDALKQELELVTVGDAEHITHDWAWLFAQLGVLRHCETIGWFTRQLGFITMLIGLGFGAWLMWQMFQRPGAQKRMR